MPLKLLPPLPSKPPRRGQVLPLRPEAHRESSDRNFRNWMNTWIPAPSAYTHLVDLGFFSLAVYLHAGLILCLWLLGKKEPPIVDASLRPPISIHFSAPQLSPEMRTLAAPPPAPAAPAPKKPSTPPSSPKTLMASPANPPNPSAPRVVAPPIAPAAPPAPQTWSQSAVPDTHTPQPATAGAPSRSSTPSFGSSQGSPSGEEGGDDLANRPPPQSDTIVRSRSVEISFPTAQFVENFNRSFSDSWGGTRTLSSASFVGVPGEIIEYAIYINSDGSLKRWVNLSKERAPNRDFSAVDKIFEDVLLTIVPVQIPKRLQDSIIRIPKQIRFVGNRFFNF